MPTLSSSHYFLFLLHLNGKGSNILSGHSSEAWRSCHQNGFFFPWMNHFHKFSFRRGWTIILFSLFLFEAGSWPRKVGCVWCKADMMVWSYKFHKDAAWSGQTRISLGWREEGSFPWELLAVHGSAASYPWANLEIINCATLETPLSFSPALRQPLLPYPHWRGRRKETTPSYSLKISSKWQKKNITPPQSSSNSKSLESNGSLTGNKWSSESWKTLQDYSQ